MSVDRTIQIGDICKALDVSDRDARYVLERGFVPKGVYVNPASGTHRQFSGGQAFWLGLVLKLKGSGVKTPLAAKIADYAGRCIQTVSQNFVWDYLYLPTQGRLSTEKDYRIEIADLKYIRFGTDAGPGTDGYEWFDWQPIKKLGKPVSDIQPYVIIQVDLARISQQLQQAFQSQED